MSVNKIPDLRNEFIKARHAAGLTQKDLAKLAKINIKTVEGYEQRRHEMSMRVYVECMAVMGVTIKFEGEE